MNIKHNILFLLLAGILFSCDEVDLEIPQADLIQINGTFSNTKVVDSYFLSDGSAIFDFGSQDSLFSDSIMLDFRLLLPDFDKGRTVLDDESIAVMVAHGLESSRDLGGVFNLTGVNSLGYESNFTVNLIRDNESFQISSSYLTLLGPDSTATAFVTSGTATSLDTEYLNMRSTYSGRVITAQSIALSDQASLIMTFDNNIAVGTYDLAPLIPGSEEVELEFNSATGVTYNTVASGSLTIDKVDSQNGFIFGSLTAEMTSGTATVSIEFPFKAVLAN